MKQLLIVIVIGAALAGALGWSFLRNRGETAREAAAEQAVGTQRRVSTENGERVVNLDAATQKQSGLELAKPGESRFPQQLRAYGTVLDVQPLMDLARNYTGAKSRHQAALAKLQASRNAFERARKLHQDDENVSTAQFQAAEATYRADDAAFAAADSDRRTFAATAQQAWGPVIGRALVDGGSMIERLIERNDVLLQITLPAGSVVSEPPEVAYVELTGGSRANVRFVSRATRTDPAIQGLSFYYTAPADSGLLPGMNVLAYLPSGGTVEGKVVPASAVVWWQGRAWVYLRKDPETFLRHAITTDQPAPGGGYIVQALPNDAELVVKGAQMLLSEELRAAAIPGAGDRQ